MPYNAQAQQLEALMMQADPSLAKLVTQQASDPAAQQAVGEFNAALQSAGLSGQVGGVSPFSDQVEQLSYAELQFLDGWFRDKAAGIINTITNMVQNYQHCAEGVRLATEIVRAFQSGNYLECIAKAPTAFAAFQRCVG